MSFAGWHSSLGGGWRIMSKLVDESSLARGLKKGRIMLLVSLDLNKRRVD
jgi:hypothetical protein